MLRNYKYYVHPLDQLHNYVVVEAFTYICNAGPGDVFDITVLSPALQDILNKEKENSSDLLYKPLNTLFDIIKNEPTAVKQTLQNALVNNNDIQSLCSDTGIDPLLYDELPAAIVDELKPFLTSLYERLLNRAYVKKNYGSMKEHFNMIIKNNEMRVCPFCGMNDLKSEFDDGRDAYDHYLPKGTFPFSSINFHNLVPMCNECNSGNKLEKVLIYEDVKTKAPRKRAFYPFTDQLPGINVSFTRTDKTKIPPDLNTLQPEDIEITIECPEEEKAGSWDRVFGISKRYKAKSCADVKMWLESLLLEFKNFKQGLLPGLQWNDFITTKITILEGTPIQDKNFLKASLLRFLKTECRLVEVLQMMESVNYKE